jgi:hypothetical protein
VGYGERFHVERVVFVHAVHAAICAGRLVDTFEDRPQIFAMSEPRKIHKVEEPAAPYSAAPKSPAKNSAEVRYAIREDVLKTNERLMKVHRKVLEKLAK